MRILHVVGARPNFMKAAPVLRALDAHPGAQQILIHTGQHYDASMSGVFFQQLGMPQPDINLAVGSGSHAQQTGEIMMRIEPVVTEYKPDIVLIYGDVNSTLAAALVCSKLGVKVGHIEAGLRSFDRTMPEEINRLLTDQLADLLFTPSEDGNENLAREGIAADKVHLVGNVMIDTLVRLLPCAGHHRSEPAPERYILLTLHRPANVDEPDLLRAVINTLGEISSEIDILFPVHPRTRKRLLEYGIDGKCPRLHYLEPLPYLEFLALQRDAAVVITDSGGIQEETTYLGVPCLTVRDNTERPVTITLGTNVLVGRSAECLRAELKDILTGKHKASVVPPLWDGHASERIAAIVANSLL